MSFANTGKVWTLDSFKDYLKTVSLGDKPWFRAVCLHHTAAPSLHQRPDGLLVRHLENMRGYYQNQLRWRSGPHLFIDDDQVWGMTPLTVRGVHAASFNSYSIGIEVLGDYDNEDPKKGRGLACWETAAAATKMILDWAKLPVNDKTVLFHRDDPRTTKSCPGTKVGKPWVLDLIKNSSPLPSLVKEALKPATPTFQALYPALIRKGYSDFEIKNGLKITNGKVFWRNTWLEKAYYDKTAQTTLASSEEIALIPQRC
jgi:hypothetical protein